MSKVNKRTFLVIKVVTILWNIVWGISLYGSYLGIQQAKNAGIDELQVIWTQGLEQTIILGLLINAVLLPLFFVFRSRKRKEEKGFQDDDNSINSEEDITSESAIGIEEETSPGFSENSKELDIPGVKKKNLKTMQRFVQIKNGKLADAEIAQILIWIYDLSPEDARLVIEATLGRAFAPDKQPQKKVETKNRGRTIKVLRITFELIYLIILSFLFDTITWNIEVPYRDYYGDYAIAYIDWNVGVFLIGCTIGLMALILIFEWVRRRTAQDTRPTFEKYIYIPAIFLVFVMGILIARFLLLDYR